MSYEERHRVPGSQPYLRGHFSGNPVVPAVIILELVLETIRRWKGDVVVTRVPNAKFMAPLRPDVDFRICLKDSSDRAIGFECKARGLVFASGTADVGVSDSAK